MIGVAIIGYGYWGPNLARCFAETEGCPRGRGRRQASPAALASVGEAPSAQPASTRIGEKP
jgi:glycerol-3-phosphate dehydrogenase